MYRLIDFNGAVVHSFQPTSSIIPTVIVWAARAFTKAASSGLDYREVSVINLDGATPTALTVVGADGVSARLPLPITLKP